MIVYGLILIEGKNVEERDLNINLSNAKPKIVGRIPTLGIILHLAANSAEDYNKAFVDYATIPNVTGVLPLMIRKGI